MSKNATRENSDSELTSDLQHGTSSSSATCPNLNEREPQDRTTRLRALLEEHERNNDETSGAAVLRAAASPELTEENAKHLLHSLLNTKTSLLQRTDILVLVLARQSGRKALLSRACADDMAFVSLFQQTCSAQNSAMLELIKFLLDKNIWVSHINQRAGIMEKTLSVLLDTLRNSNITHTDTSIIQCSAFFISAEPDLVVSKLNQKYFEQILLVFSTEMTEHIRASATVFIAKFLEAAPEEGQKWLTGFVMSRVARQSIDEFIVAFSVSAAVFPIVPTISATLFVTDGFIDDIISIVSQLINLKLNRAVLDLLSAACIDGKCRAIIQKKCSLWLIELARGGVPDEDKTLAALVLIKSQGVTTTSQKQPSGIVQSDEDLVDLFKDMLLVEDEAVSQNAMEGLAYGSIQAKTKTRLADDRLFLNHLVEIMKTSKTRTITIFGGLTIISNLSAYPPVLSREQKRMAQLKAYANHSKPGHAEQYEKEDQVTDRCAKLIAAGVVPAMIACSRVKTATVMQLVAGIMLSLTKNSKHRGSLVQQGLLDTMIRYANVSNDKDNVIHTASRQSALALARTLISINPALIFRKVPVETAIRPLMNLLRTPDEAITMLAEDDGRDTEPTFEALRALTNLASMDERTRILITEQAFPLITTQLWSSNLAIVQATTECILNLTISYSAASKFFLSPSTLPDTHPTSTASASKPAAMNKMNSNNTLHLLSALAHAASPGTRRAATATLAHILAWPEGVTSFLALERGVEALMSVITEAVADDDLDWLTRGVTAILLLLTTEVEKTAGNNGDRAEQVKGSTEAKKRVMGTKGQQIFQAIKKSGIWKERDETEMIDSILLALQ